MKPGQKFEFSLVTANVLAVTMDDPVWMNDTLKIDGRKFRYFRDGRDGGKTAYCFIARPPSELTGKDIAAIGALLDRNEGARNRRVKECIAGSLARHFNGRSFHLYEPGCGQYPIAPYLPANASFTYRGIESDPACIAALQRQGLAASSWKEALRAKKSSDAPSVCASVYALHFMNDKKFPERIARLTGEDGFFIGNYFMHPHERKTGKGRARLSAALREAGLARIVVNDKDDAHNEYWIVGRSPKILRGYADSFKR